MPTLQDVAKRAGVSTATVSKVLSNTPYVSEATRMKVLQAVAELDYRPNLAARALSSGKTNIVAVVFPYIYDAIFKDPHVMSLLEGVEMVTSQQEYNLLLSTPRFKDGQLDANYQQLIRSGYIEGIIAIDNVPIASAAQVAGESGIPTVVIGHHEAAYTVHSNDYLGGRLLASHVFELGHRNIGIISVPEDINYALTARLRGVQSVAEDYDIVSESLSIVNSNLSILGGQQATDTLLQLQPSLTAIIALNDRMAMGAIQYLQSQNYRVPQDISVVGYDNLAITSLFTPRVTTIDQQAINLGQTAARLLFDVLANREPSSVVLSPELIVRDSASAPRS